VFGFTRENCTDLCNRTLNPTALSSLGCISPNISCNNFTNLFCDPQPEGCNVVWTLPQPISLLPISTFTFSLGNAYIQELLIRVSLSGEDSVSQDNIPSLGDTDTARIFPAYVEEPLQLLDTQSQVLLFDVERQYELNYVLQESDSQTSESDTDYKMTAVILPLQGNIIDARTSDQQYFGTNTANQITLQFTKPNFYIGNTEGRIYQSGALFLTLVNVLAGILGIFQLFGAVMTKCAEIGRGVYEGNLIKSYSRQRGLDGSVQKSPRYDRHHYNPYDIQSIMQAFVDHDFQNMLHEGKKTRKQLQEEE